MFLFLALLIMPLVSSAVDTNPNSNTETCVSFSYGLNYQSRDATTNGEVSKLQNFLQSKGYLNSEPTGYFGLLTTQAVKNFQNANGLVGDGNVGPTTRAKIYSLTCGTLIDKILGQQTNQQLDWAEIKEITIDNFSNFNTLVNYQIKIIVTYEPEMQLDFDDIRFVDSDGVTFLDYWLESKVDSRSAIFWVKVPNIPATSSKTIYMYYGNLKIGSMSNGDKTFEFFDDFIGNGSTDFTNMTKVDFVNLLSGGEWFSNFIYDTDGRLVVNKDNTTWMYYSAPNSQPWTTYTRKVDVDTFELVGPEYQVKTNDIDSRKTWTVSHNVIKLNNSLYLMIYTEQLPKPKGTLVRAAISTTPNGSFSRVTGFQIDPELAWESSTLESNGLWRKISEDASTVVAYIGYEHMASDTTAMGSYLMGWAKVSINKNNGNITLIEKYANNPLSVLEGGDYRAAYGGGNIDSSFKVNGLYPVFYFTLDKATGKYHIARSVSSNPMFDTINDKKIIEPAIKSSFVNEVYVEKFQYYFRNGLLHLFYAGGDKGGNTGIRVYGPDQGGLDTNKWSVGTGVSASISNGIASIKGVKSNSAQSYIKSKTYAAGHNTAIMYRTKTVDDSLETGYQNISQGGGSGGVRLINQPWSSKTEHLTTQNSSASSFSSYVYDMGWHTKEIRRLQTSAHLVVDGVQKASVASNLPVSNLNVFLAGVNTNGNYDFDALFDWIAVRQYVPIEPIVTINSISNNPPTVNAGIDQTITAVNSVSLSGSVTDDGFPKGNSISTTWTKVSGPGIVTFVNANTLETSANFSAIGSYVLRLSATDGILSSTDDVGINFSDSTSAILEVADDAVEIAGKINVSWKNIPLPSNTDWIGLYTSSTSVDTDYADWHYTKPSSGSCSKSPKNASSSGSCSFIIPSSATPGTTYEFRLFSNKGWTRLATSKIFSVLPSTNTKSATLSVAGSSVQAGNSINVSWNNIPLPFNTDWIGLYSSSSSTDKGYVDWNYTRPSSGSCSKSPKTPSFSGSCSFTIPSSATPGTTYEFRLFSNNAWEKLATSAAFSVIAATEEASSSSSGGDSSGAGTGSSSESGSSSTDANSSSSESGSVYGAESFVFTQLLKVGSRGNAVMELQKFLNSNGYNCGVVDGIFGPKVKAAVVQFQTAKKLKIDGIVGPQVRGLLNQTQTTSTLNVLSPNGGEEWQMRTTKTISWSDVTPLPGACPAGADCSTSPKYYDITLQPKYVCDAGPGAACATVMPTPYTLKKNATGSSLHWTVGDYDWGSLPNNAGALPPIYAGQYTVQVCKTNTSICDSSNSYFTITSN